MCIKVVLEIPTNPALLMANAPAPNRASRESEGAAPAGAARAIDHAPGQYSSIVPVNDCIFCRREVGIK